MLGKPPLGQRGFVHGRREKPQLGGFPRTRAAGHWKRKPRNSPRCPRRSITAWPKPSSPAVEKIRAASRVIVTGMGKSGHIGRKIAATFASTGTPVFACDSGEPRRSRHDQPRRRHRGALLVGRNRKKCAISSNTPKLIAVTANAKSTLAKATNGLLLLPQATDMPAGSRTHDLDAASARARRCARGGAVRKPRPHRAQFQGAAPRRQTRSKPDLRARRDASKELDPARTRHAHGGRDRRDDVERLRLRRLRGRGAR